MRSRGSTHASSTCAPIRMALRATSIATLPPPSTRTRGPNGWPSGVSTCPSTREYRPRRTSRRKCVFTKTPPKFAPAPPDRHQNRLVALIEQPVEVVDAGVEAELDAQVEDVGDLALDDLGRQPVLRDADAQHPAGNR